MDKIAMGLFIVGIAGVVAWVFYPHVYNWWKSR